MESARSERLETTQTRQPNRSKAVIATHPSPSSFTQQIHRVWKSEVREEIVPCGDPRQPLWYGRISSLPVFKLSARSEPSSGRIRGGQ